MKSSAPTPTADAPAPDAPETRASEPQTRARTATTSVDRYPDTAASHPDSAEEQYPNIDAGTGGKSDEIVSNPPERPGNPPETSPDAPFRLDDFLPYQLVRLATLLSRDLAALYGARHGLTIPEWRVLAHLSQADAVSIRDIHARVDLDKPAVSRAARRLADAGLVSRAEAADRRLVALSLTPEGLALMAELVPLALARETEALAPLTPEERETFRALLARLLAARG